MYYNENGFEQYNIDVSKIFSIGLVFSSINGIARFLAYKLTSNAIIGSYFTTVAWGIMLAVFVLKYWRWWGNRIVTAIILYGVFIGCMYVFFPLSRNYIHYYANDLIIYAAVGMPMMVLARKFDSWDFLVTISRPVLRTVAVMSIVTYIWSGGTFFTPMEWGNRITPITLCYLVYFVYGKKKIDYIIMPLLLVVSLLGGRQSFLFVVLALVLAIVLMSNTKIKKVITIACGILGTVILIKLDYLLTILIVTLEKAGIYARALERLANGFFQDSGRSLIYSACREIISQNGIKINGIFADHYFVANMHIGKNYTFAHNFIYEIIIDFGIIVGGLLIAWLFFVLVRRIFECKKEYRLILYIAIIYGLGRIFVSSSIFIYFNFVILIGLLFNEELFNFRFRFVFGKPNKY